MRHCPIGDKTRDAEGAGQQSCVDLEAFARMLGKDDSPGERFAATHGIANQFIHQRVGPFVARP